MRRGLMPSSHAAVKHELLVRHLDAWTPAVLHGNKRVTYVDRSGSPASAIAAARVFGEFADLLERHTLTMVVPIASLDSVADVVREYGSPAGLVVNPSSGLSGEPTFGWFDEATPSVLEELTTVLKHRSSEVLVAMPAGASRSRPEPGSSSTWWQGLRTSRLAAAVELAGGSGSPELLVFATSSEKSLERFKDELWALDEYAGTRYRDPGDDEATLLDISLQPNLRPLRRALLAQLASAGESTVAALRSYAIHETIYRAADATQALHAMISAREVERTPTGGRLTADTLVTPVSRRG